jgi:hypothetical protein
MHIGNAERAKAQVESSEHRERATELHLTIGYRRGSPDETPCERRQLREQLSPMVRLICGRLPDFQLLSCTQFEDRRQGVDGLSLVLRGIDENAGPPFSGPSPETAEKSLVEAEDWLGDPIRSHLNSLAAASIGQIATRLVHFVVMGFADLLTISCRDEPSCQGLELSVTRNDAGALQVQLGSSFDIALVDPEAEESGLSPLPPERSLAPALAS